MRKVWTSACAAAFIVSISGLAIAHSGATGIVKERMELMKGIANQMKTIGSMVKGERNFSAEEASAAASMIATKSENVSDLFPEDSIMNPSEALPTIWEDWDAFVRLSEEMNTHAKTLAEASINADDVTTIRAAFVRLAKTCSSCHEDFRQDK
jgi:cytochrome c556